MPEFFKKLFTSDFMPHGHCMFWQPEVLWLHIISDGLIAISYFSIPIALIYLVRRRQDLAFNWAFLMFAVFILACGTNHIIDIWTLWTPVYRFEGLMKFVTAMASVTTAVLIWPMIPKALALPSLTQLEEANSNLQSEILERKKAEEQLKITNEKLESLVEERTADLVKANSELRESREQYKQLYELAPDMFLSLDPVNDNILKCNYTLATQLGYSKTELVGNSILAICHPDCRKTLKDSLKVLSAKTKVNGLDLRLIQKDSTTLDVTLNALAVLANDGNISHYSTVIRDVSQIKEAQNLLQENEKRLRIMLESLPNAILLVDENGKIELSNSRTERYFGYKKEELIEEEVKTLISARFHSAYSNHLQSFWKNPTRQQTSYNLELFAKNKDGTEFPAEIGFTRCQISETTYILCSIIDISERKIAEKARGLEKSNSELKQFASIASHDLQEPLRTIAGFAKLLDSKYKDKLTEEANQYLDFIIKGTMQMKATISDLLELASIERQGTKPVEMDCNKLVDDVLTALQVSIQDNRATVNVGTLPTIYGHRTQLFRVFQNIIGNALKFNKKQSVKVEICALEEQDKWTFSIRDNGIGIEPDYKERIFEMFKRLHSRQQYSGTGIGLSICKKIIEQHEGEIWVESSPGEGADFKFSISKNLSAYSTPVKDGCLSESD